jgi:hypothetical protein
VLIGTIPELESHLRLDIDVIRKKIKPRPDIGLVEHIKILGRMSRVDFGNGRYKNFKEDY